MLSERGGGGNEDEGEQGEIEGLARDRRFREGSGEKKEQNSK